MTNLSPAAQAVLDAAADVYWDWSDMSPASSSIIAAAALRAVASQFDRPNRSDAHTLWNEGFQHAQRIYRAELLNIADELETQ